MSDRKHHLTIPNLVPKELEIDKELTQVTPTILEVFLNKTCNMKCTYCNSAYSSQINNEAKKFGPILDSSGQPHPSTDFKPTHVDHKFYLDKTLEWIEKNHKNLKRLHLLGGETFYQTELQEVLNVLKKCKNRNLQLNIVSNLMVKEEFLIHYISQIKELIVNKNIGRFNLTVSIDGWGPEAEYARTGLKLNHFEKLFNYVSNEKWIFLNTNQTITCLTIRCIPELIKFLNNHRKTRRINQELGLVQFRPHMHPGIYGRDFWKKDFEKILELMSEDNESNKTSKEYMKGIFLSLPTSSNKKSILELKHYLDQLDQRRKTNWRKIYPYLDI